MLLPEALTALHQELGIPVQYLSSRAQQCCLEATELVDAGLDIYQRPQRMTAETYQAWHAMQHAAASQQITLQLVSAFRDYAYQAQLIRRKLQRGLAIAEILQINAAPGFSEHHSGRALDLTTPGCAVLEEEFADTPAFAWLEQHAAMFGFRLSFPRDNLQGVIYEPWHWYYWGLPSAPVAIGE